MSLIDPNSIKVNSSFFDVNDSIIAKKNEYSEKVQLLRDLISDVSSSEAWKEPGVKEKFIEKATEYVEVFDKVISGIQSTSERNVEQAELFNSIESAFGGGR